MYDNDLWTVRRRLDKLTQYRLVRPLSDDEQAEYDALAKRETELLALRQTARDSESAQESGPRSKPPGS